MMTGDDQTGPGLLIPPSVCIQMEVKAPAWVAAAGLSLMLMGFYLNRITSLHWSIGLISRKIIQK